jgi:putative ABC transport system permease protein
MNLERQMKYLEFIRSSYKKYSPDYPIQFSFLDKDFEWQFHTELMVAALSKCFTVIAIIISCLGLFGLALFNTERCVKEISIRKVLGASISELVVLLCRDFVRLVVYAIAIGGPIAYYLMEKFLKGHAYHTELNFWMFAIPALSIFLISLCIISMQSIKAALSNPADAMRTE